MNPLFVCGCPRSGTSAVAMWLTQMNEIAIGMERYQQYWRKHQAFPDNALTFDRFFDIKQGDTWYNSLDQFPNYYQGIREKYNSAFFVGDKIPRLWENFDSVFRQFSGARVIYTLRDPFAVAHSYKVRALDPNDQLWGNKRDTNFAIQEWNESVKYLIDFFNSDMLIGKYQNHDLCYILRYEEFCANSIDRRTLNAFLNKQFNFGINLQRSKDKTDLFTDIERELLWTLLDVRLIEEANKIIESQAVHFLRKVSQSKVPNKRREWYHTSDKRDADIDYGEFFIPGCNYVFRGQTKPVDTTKPYIAAIGSATTFGRFIKQPYSFQLEEAIGLPVVNLGIGGARPESYLGNSELVNFLQKASLVIIEMMSARGYSSPLFSPISDIANMGWFMDAFGLAKYAKEDAKLERLLTKSMKKEAVFVDHVYEITFKYLTRKQRDIVRDTVVLRYINDLKQLIKEIGKPVVTLLITRDQPYYYARRSPNSPNSLHDYTGNYPHFIDEIVLQFIKQQSIPIIESRSSRGVPYEVRNWATDEPAPVFSWQQNPALNTYYPSQEMHNDAVVELLKYPAIQAICNDHAKPNKNNFLGK